MADSEETTTPETAKDDEPEPRSFFLGKKKEPKKNRRILRILIFVVFILAIYDLSTAKLATKYDLKQPRDPETGILVGAEPRLLGPEDADTAILFVHGFVGGSNNFNDIPDLLAEKEGYRIKMMLLPGHGTSPKDFAETTAEEMLNAVLDEVNALKEKHKRVILVGHSMGGALSTIVASTEELDGLILAAPYYRVTHQWYYGLPVETWNALTGPVILRVYKGDAFIRVAKKENRPNILSYRWIPSKGSATLTAIGKQARDPETLAAITEPTLVLHGRHDFAASPKASKEALDQMSSESKTYVDLHHSDHHIFWDYDHLHVYKAFVAFLNELNADEARAEELYEKVGIIE
ncbi:MAG: alpha/beta fold hydrolase [Candidatus Hydrogenedentota bacterium]